VRDERENAFRKNREGRAGRRILPEPGPRGPGAGRDALSSSRSARAAVREAAVRVHP